MVGVIDPEYVNDNICSKCGCEVEPDVKFCSSYGNKLS